MGLLQSPGETVDAVMLVLRERGQQGSAEREARLREHFQQLRDLPHTRKLLVEEMRELVAGLGSERACRVPSFISFKSFDVSFRRSAGRFSLLLKS